MKNFNIRYSLNVHKFFHYTCKNNALKKSKHSEIVEPAFKYILACNAPPVLRIFNNSLKPHISKIRSASFEYTLTAPNDRVH